MLIKDLSALGPEERAGLIDRSSRVDTAVVEDIIHDVRERGDEALRELTKRFDGADLKDLRVSEEELLEARSKADPDIVKAIQRAHVNILRFHERLRETEVRITVDEMELGQILRPVESVGCYVPGGRAFYPSTVLMSVVPARVAGVKRVAVTTPPDRDGKVNEHTLAACEVAGVDEVYKVGGAQAIAALAYGTESIPKVDLIVGPGNAYVTAAKRAVYGDVGVDMLAGPSEVLIIADSTADPEFIAADILAQAEHDPDATGVLVSTNPDVARAVIERLEKRKREENLQLRNIAILSARDMEEAVGFSNRFGPEHLEIMTDDYESVLEKVTNAGSIFLGSYSPVAAGDYASGPNHILPTGGCSRFQSGLNVGHFLRRISVQKLSREGLKGIAGTVITLAEAEGLKYHSESVKKRLKR